MSVPKTLEEIAGEVAEETGAEWDDVEATLIEFVDELLSQDEASEVFGSLQVAGLRPTGRYGKRLRQDLIEHFGGGS